jgi:rRNA maturation endonuclease Nob1
MNEYQIDCEICESTVIVYNEEEDEPAFCPMCGSSLLATEVTDV